MPGLLLRETPTAGANGELTGVAAVTRMPDVPCQMVIFKAGDANTGSAHIGFNSATTVDDSSTDTTTGLCLAAGQFSPWIPVDNMNKLYYVCDGTGDDLTYLAVK